MTKTEYTEEQLSKLDRYVAEKVMGYVAGESGLVWSDRDHRTMGFIHGSGVHEAALKMGLERTVYSPTRNITQAWDVVNMMNALGFCPCIHAMCWTPEELRENVWEADFQSRATPKCNAMTYPTVEVAICLSALVALGHTGLEI